MTPPASVVRAIRLIWTLVALALLVTVLAFVFDDQLVAAWAGERGLSVDDTRVPPSFTPVAIVLFVVVASLVLVLMSFLRGGHNWARHSLAASAVYVSIGTVALVRTAPPWEFVVPAAVSLVVQVGLLACLYHPDTSRFVGPRYPVAPRP